MIFLSLLLPVVALFLGYHAGWCDGLRAGQTTPVSRPRVRRGAGLTVVAGGRLR